MKKTALILSAFLIASAIASEPKKIDSNTSIKVDSNATKKAKKLKKIKKNLKTALFKRLGNNLNSPISATMDKKGNIYFVSPNFKNRTLRLSGVIKGPLPPVIGKIDTNGRFSEWYTFKPEDLDLKSQKIMPFSIAFGPDGNLYLVDNQMWVAGISKIKKFEVKNDKVIGSSTVVEGLMFPNDIVFKGNDMLVSEMVLGKDGKKTISGIFKIPLDEIKNSPKRRVTIAPYNKNEDMQDAHLLMTYKSSGKYRYGIGGMTIDEKGNLYSAVMEDGVILKTTFKPNGKEEGTIVFAKGIEGVQGLFYDKKSETILAASLLTNKIFGIDMNGEEKVLAQSGDTEGENGELDAPSDLLVRNGKLYVTNLDAVFKEKMTNTKADKVHTISVIELY